MSDTPRTQAMMEKAAQHVMDKMPITGADAVIAFMDSVTDEVQAMERELAVACFDRDAYKLHMETATFKLGKAEAALAACQKDAERYRWLRNKPNPANIYICAHVDGWAQVRGDAADGIIDAAKGRP